SKEILDQEQIDFQLLEPLVRESVMKAFTLGPEKAQTGPAKRGDCSITDKHKSLLKNKKWRELYSLMSDMIREDFKRNSSGD
nr:DUF2520 domain-containing protein [Bacteroidota bacterium]